MSIGHQLNRKLEVWRAVVTPDDQGGREETRALVATLPAKIDQPSAVTNDSAERMTGGKWGVRSNVAVYFAPNADVQRGDDLIGYPEGRLRVVTTVYPSRRIYLRAVTELFDAEVPTDG